MKALKTDASARELVERLETGIPALMEKDNVPGLSLALVRDAELLWHRGFGVRSVLSRTPVTDDTAFEAGSLSKPVFAYVAPKLCESGALDLDVPLARYMPEPYVPGEPRLEQITMRHVLSHTTGFPNWRPKDEPLRIHFSPGERFSYSGEGFMYLQAVVAHVTGQEPAQYVASNLLEPLGMKHSHFLWDGQEGLPVAVGHDGEGKATEKKLWRETCAAASLHCTAIDFAGFMCAVMRPSESNPAHLGPEMAAAMLSTQVQVNDSSPWHDDWPKPQIKLNDLVGWGLGWGTQHTPAGDSIWHWCNNGTYRAFAVGYPRKGHGMVVMTNGQNGQAVINRIVQDIVGGYYPGLRWLYG